MKKFIISEEEKKRILDLHLSEIKHRYINEQVKQGAQGDPFQYKKEGGKYFYAKKGQQNWIEVKTEKALKSIKTNIFGEKLVQSPKTPSTVKSTTPVPTPQSSGTDDQSSWFDSAKEFCAHPIERLKKLKNTITNKFNEVKLLKPHIRAFMDFLNGRQEPITQTFFNSEELKLIADKVNSDFSKSSTCKRNKKCNVSFYSSDTDWGKVKSGEEKVVNPDLAKSIGFTIGNASVTDEGDKFKVKDIYDFNNFQKNPQAYSSENAGDTIGTALKKITCGNYIQGLEELASFKQASGYKGIPVEIEIPKYSVKS